MDVMAGNLVELQDVYFARGERAIFRGVTLKVPRGKIVAIMGPSGTGKTTLLKLISGQLVPQSGVVQVDGRNVNQLKRAELYQLRKIMGMLFQSGALFTNLSVYENVAFPLREHYNMPEDQVRELVLSQLERVGLREACQLMPSELSGGMARRVALARALITKPQLMLYDEPFTGQDPITMGVLVKLIKELNQAMQLTSVIVSHDVAETMSIADYVYVVAGGKVIGEGMPQDIASSHSALVRQFIDGLVDGPIPFHYQNHEPEQAFAKMTKLA